MKTITHKTMAFFAVLLAMLLFWAGIGSVMPAVDLTAAAWTSDMTDEEMQQFADDVIALVNQERAAEGIDPVYALPILNEAAAVRAKECTELFEHERPDGTSCATVLDEFGVTWHAWGENIAYGYSSPKNFMEGWMNSEGHRKNILNSSYTHMGVGVTCFNGIIYCTQSFVGRPNITDGEYMPELRVTTTTTTITTTTTSATTTAAITVLPVPTYEYTIYEEEENAITVQSGYMKYYRFIPDYSGTYYFYTTGSIDTIGELYDTYGSHLESDDDSGEDFNFELSYDLYEGATYYIGVEGLYESGSTSLYVSRTGGATVMTTDETETAATTTTTAVTDVVQEAWLQGEEVELSASELVGNGYIVNIPLTFQINTGIKGLEFGLSWDSEMMTIMNVTCDAENMMISSRVNTDEDFLWVSFACLDDAHYGDELCTLQFWVSDAVLDQEGAGLLSVNMETDSPFGLTANAYGPDGSSIDLTMSSPVWVVISPDDPDVTTTTTQVTEEPNSTSTVTTLEEYDVVAQVDSVEISLEELQANDYQISIPMRYIQNSGFTAMSFGIKTDSSLLQLESCQSDTSMLLCASTISHEKDMVWLSLLSQQGDLWTGYEDYTGEEFCTLTFTISPDVQPGDVMEIYGVYTDAVGDPYMANNAEDEDLALLVNTGQIVISGEPTAKIHRGDLNGDGVVSLADVVLLSKTIIGVTQYTIETDSALLKSADINGDGVIGSDDAALLLQFLNKIVDEI